MVSKRTNQYAVIQFNYSSIFAHLSLKTIVLMALSLLVSAIAPAVEFDISYSPVANGSAEQGLAGWTAANAVALETTAPQGSHCFKLTAAADTPGTLTSSLMPARRGENLKLTFHLKTDAGADIKDEAAFVSLRSYKSDGKTLLSQSRVTLEPTEGKWLEQTHELTADVAAYYVDIQFQTTAPAALFIDAISLFREIKHSPLYADIKPLSENDTLYVFTKGPGSEDNQFIAIQTLQGVVARKDRPRLWIDAGDNTFVEDFQKQYKIRFDRSMARDCAGLLEALKPWTSGTYVLYDLRDRPSLSAAATMAGLLDAVAVDTALEPTAIAKGYIKALDVRGKDCRWVYETYRDRLNDDLLIVHTNNPRFHRSAPYLKDWAAATRALSWWYDDESVSRAVYRSMAPSSPVYGWLDASTKDEGLSVKLHSEEGLFQMPSDWMLNLSVHAAMGPALKDKTFTQKVTRTPPVKETGVHYVTFIMSDMDNILTEIGTKSFYSSRKFYANPHRGQFPMTWGMAPALVELSPNGVDLWYRAATPKDAFIAYCGPGYFYPASSPYMQTSARRVGDWMKRADLQVLLLIDYLLPDKPLSNAYYDTAKWFTALDQVKGLIYLEYIQYAPHGGKIFWFDDKPMVTPRFDFRQETFYSAVRPTAAELAKSINALPKDPTRPEGYTAVTVHAWSKGMNDIHDTIQLLDPSVRVVNAEEFIELITLNMKP
ncbi:MAG: GxGYxYP domain-containing protein [Anaerohalosphaeraceae bacterium]